MIGAVSISDRTTCAQWAPDRPPMVTQREDGRIVVEGGPVFDTWADYFRSTTFLRLGRRCGTPPPMLQENQQPAGQGILGGGPQDCSLAATNPDPIYAFGTDDPVYRIPVVFHVIRNAAGTLGDVSPACIQRQIDILNEDFRAIAGSGVDSGIEFCLADTDPAGKPTIGITYSNNDAWFNDQGTYYQDLAWDPTRYLNIYSNTASGALGYVAFFPQQGPTGSAADRIVLLWVTVGGCEAADPPYDLGRTLTHEAGHYFGLLHTFQGGCGSVSCATTGDLICDTDAQANPNFGCPSSASSCGTPDPIRNYMNYTDDACMNRFSAEQVARMRCTIVNYRSSLPSPDAGCTVTIENCTNGVDDDGNGLVDCDDPACGGFPGCGCSISSFTPSDAWHPAEGTWCAIDETFNCPEIELTTTCDGWWLESSASWLEITSGWVGPGYGPIRYRVHANASSGSRMALIHQVGDPEGVAFTVTQGGAPDCNENGIPDPIEIESETASDCNANGIPDVCDIATGSSPDVDGDGVPDECSPNGTVIRVPEDVATLRRAVEVAPDGATVSVGPGIHVGGFDFEGRELHLESRSGPETTVIEGTASEATVIRMACQVDAGSGDRPRPSLRGFTIRRPSASSGPGTLLGDGGGVQVENVDATIEHCVFENLVADRGGAIAIASGSLSIKSSRLVANEARVGGAIFVAGGVVSMVGCVLSANQAEQGGAVGGDAGEMVVELCTFSANASTTLGGAIAWGDGQSGAIRVMQTYLEANQAEFGGGIASLGDPSRVEVESSIICRNDPDEIFGSWIDLGGNQFCACAADLDADGRVDAADLAIVLASWGSCDHAVCLADVDRSGAIDGADLGMIVASWGECP